LSDQTFDTRAPVKRANGAYHAPSERARRRAAGRPAPGEVEAVSDPAQELPDGVFFEHSGVGMDLRHWEQHCPGVGAPVARLGGRAAHQSGLGQQCVGHVGRYEGAALHGRLFDRGSWQQTVTAYALDMGRNPRALVLRGSSGCRPG
jgi:hypothetical protein